MVRRQRGRQQERTDHQHPHYRCYCRQCRESCLSTGEQAPKKKRRHVIGGGVPFMCHAGIDVDAVLSFQDGVILSTFLDIFGQFQSGHTKFTTQQVDIVTQETILVAESSRLL